MTGATAEAPGPKGMVEGVGFPNVQRVVTQPPGVEQAANGSVCRYGRNVGSPDCGLCTWLPTRLTDAKMPVRGPDVGGGIVAK
jgi:hypothetical protein